ncbi:ADP-ribosylating toxin [Streptomyces sp. URMC 124]|uniref:ADP-ribosylating toxin n=1 Tax=Streptomyces sp. URMC 124 TaxID=3423405 RepID=UPI003F1B99C1
MRPAKPARRQRPALQRMFATTAFAGMMAAASAELAHAAPAPGPGGDRISRAKQTGLEGFHGYKPGHLDSILEGLRPVGTAGNHDPDWKGLYLAETTGHAAGYSTNEAGTAAGGVVRVTLPEEVDVATVHLAHKANETGEEFLKRQLQFVKSEFGVPEDKPLMDALGEKNTVLKIADDGTGQSELIVPWKVAERGKAEKAVEFRGKNSALDAAIYAAAPANCLAPAGSSGRAKRAADRCLPVDWDEVEVKAKATAKKVARDAGHVERLPQRKPKGPTWSEAHATAELTHAKVREVSGTHVAATAAGVGTWVYGMAKTFSDKDATTLDKVAVTGAVVPGLGQALGIADGIRHGDPEAVAVNAVALAALAAAQVVPVVGEVVDAALLAEQLVEVLVDVFRTATADPPPAPRLETGVLPILPVPRASLPCSVWWTYMDVLWETAGKVPPHEKVPAKTQVVVRERGGSEYAYPVADGKSPGWLVPHGLGSSRTFDVFYRLKTDQGRILESKQRAVVRAKAEVAQCNTLIWNEDWQR